MTNSIAIATMLVDIKKMKEDIKALEERIKTLEGEQEEVSYLDLPHQDDELYKFFSLNDALGG